MDVTIIRANKGLMGGYKAVGDAEANTHVILLQEDYEALIGHYRRLVDDLNEKITQLTREKAQLAQKVSTYNRMVFQKDGDLNETRARMKEAAAEAEAEIAEANARNENLMRIIRERANAARDLRPKKQRSGYLLLSVGRNTLPRKCGCRVPIRLPWKRRSPGQRFIVICLRRGSGAAWA